MTNCSSRFAFVSITALLLTAGCGEVYEGEGAEGVQDGEKYVEASSGDARPGDASSGDASSGDADAGASGGGDAQVFDSGKDATNRDATISDAGVDAKTPDGQVADAVRDTSAPEVQAPDAAIDAGPRPPSMTLLAGALGSWGNLDGIGTAARFWGPVGVTFDGDGNLFVTDCGNEVIRKVVLATGATSLVAGTLDATGQADGVGSAASFNGPTGIVADGKGDLYVADTTNCTIRKVAVSSGTVSTFAGSPTHCGSVDGTGAAAELNQPQGIAYDGARFLYVSDSGNNTIRRIDTSTQAVLTIAGTTSSGNSDGVGAAARFSNPEGLTFDGDGNLYVVDSDNGTLRELTNLSVPSAVTVTTLMGALVIQHLSPLGNAAGVAYDGAGSLYVTNEAGQVLKVGLPSVTLTSNAGNGQGSAPFYADAVGSEAQFWNPVGIAFDTSGNYYVADVGNDAIRKVVAATGAVSTLAGLGAEVASKDGVGPAASFSGPAGIAFDGNETLYVADSFTDAIRAVNIDSGAVTTIATGTVNPLAGSLGDSPVGIALDGRGNLYIADASSETIRILVLATGAVSTFAGTPGGFGLKDGTGSSILFRTPVAVAFDGADPGNLWIADQQNCALREISLATGQSTTPVGAPGMCESTDGVGSAAHIKLVSGVAAEPNGNVYFVDGNSLRLLTTGTNEVTTLSTSGPGYESGPITTPTYYPMGGFWPSGTKAVGGFDWEGTTFQTPGVFSQLSIDPSGNLLLPDYNDPLIREINLTTMTSTAVVGISGVYGAKPGPLPTSIATSPRGAVAIPGGYAFVANQGVFIVR